MSFQLEEKISIENCQFLDQFGLPLEVPLDLFEGLEANVKSSLDYDHDSGSEVPSTSSDDDDDIPDVHIECSETHGNADEIESEDEKNGEEAENLETLNEEADVLISSEQCDPVAERIDDFVAPLQYDVTPADDEEIIPALAAIIEAIESQSLLEQVDVPAVDESIESPERLQLDDSTAVIEPIASLSITEKVNSPPVSETIELPSHSQLDDSNAFTEQVETESLLELVESKQDDVSSQQSDSSALLQQIDHPAKAANADSLHQQTESSIPIQQADCVTPPQELLTPPFFCQLCQQRCLPLCDQVKVQASAPSKSFARPLPRDNHRSFRKELAKSKPITTKTYSSSIRETQNFARKTSPFGEKRRLNDRPRWNSSTRFDKASMISKIEYPYMVNSLIFRPQVVKMPDALKRTN